MRTERADSNSTRLHPSITARAGLGVLEDRIGIAHVGDVIDAATRAGVEQVWIPRELCRRLGVTLSSVASSHPFLTQARGSHDVRPPAELGPWVYGWSRSDRGRACHVVLAELDDSPFAALSSRELLDALTRFRELVGVRYRRSPGATGSELLRATLPSDLGPGGALPAPVNSPQQELDFAWWRPPARPERNARWVYGFDLNAQYLAACSSVACALGEPGKLPAGVELRPELVGYWRARVHWTPELNMPDPLSPAARVRRLWYSTATVRLIRQLGGRVAVDEAFVYTRSRRALTRFYERLRDARAAVLHDDTRAGRALLWAVQGCYRQGIGWLAGGFHDQTDELYRPQWRHAVIATARANLFRRLVKIAAASGARPLAVQTDCVYYASDERTERDAARLLGVPLGTGLGEFKPAGRARMTHAADVLAARAPATLRHLQELAQEVYG